MYIARSAFISVALHCVPCLTIVFIFRRCLGESVDKYRYKDSHDPVAQEDHKLLLSFDSHTGTPPSDGHSPNPSSSTSRSSNRSFRTHKDASNATVFGVEQLNWFHSTLSHSTAKVHIICMGGQLLNTAEVFENMSNYPKERALLLKWLSKSPGKPIVLTGDRHSGEINKMVIDGKSIIEVCASPLTANAHPHHYENNSTRIHEKTTDTQHYGMLQLKLLDADQVRLQTGLYDSNGTVLFSHRETL